jgi:prepilin-type N-terminal cleavage/methylation domain-containing protein
MTRLIRHDRGGFTLVELMVVVAIAGIVVTGLSMVYLRYKTHNYALQAEWRMEHRARQIVTALRRDSRISQRAVVTGGGLELILNTNTRRSGPRSPRRVRYIVSGGFLRRQAIDDQGRLIGSTDLARVTAFVPEQSVSRLIQLKLKLTALVGEVTRQREVDLPLFVGGVS